MNWIRSIGHIRLFFGAKLVLVCWMGLTDQTTTRTFQEQPHWLLAAGICWDRDTVGTTPYKFITKSGEIRFDTVVSGMWKWGIHRIHPKCPSNRDRNDSRLDFWVARCEKNRHQLVVSSTHPDDRWKLIMFGVGKSSKSMAHGFHS